VAIRPVRLWGDPVLRSVAPAVTDFDRQLRALVADLTDTLREQGGAGLAAPRLGVDLRVFVPGRPQVPFWRELSRRGTARERHLPAQSHTALSSATLPQTTKTEARGKRKRTAGITG
jgi:hypothetical protein